MGGGQQLGAEVGIWLLQKREVTGCSSGWHPVFLQTRVEPVECTHVFGWHGTCDHFIFCFLTLMEALGLKWARGSTTSPTPMAGSWEVVTAGRCVEVV